MPINSDFTKITTHIRSKRRIWYWASHQKPKNSEYFGALKICFFFCSMSPMISLNLCVEPIFFLVHKIESQKSRLTFYFHLQVCFYLLGIVQWLKCACFILRFWPYPANEMYAMQRTETLRRTSNTETIYCRHVSRLTISVWLMNHFKTSNGYGRRLFMIRIAFVFASVYLCVVYTIMVNHQPVRWFPHIYLCTHLAHTSTHQTVDDVTHDEHKCLSVFDTAQLRLPLANGLTHIPMKSCGRRNRISVGRCWFGFAAEKQNMYAYILIHKTECSCLMYWIALYANLWIT